MSQPLYSETVGITFGIWRAGVLYKLLHKWCKMTIQNIGVDLHTCNWRLTRYFLAKMLLCGVSIDSFFPLYFKSEQNVGLNAERSRRMRHTNVHFVIEKKECFFTMTDWLNKNHFTNIMDVNTPQHPKSDLLCATPLYFLFSEISF